MTGVHPGWGEEFACKPSRDARVPLCRFKDFRCHLLCENWEFLLKNNGNLFFCWRTKRFLIKIRRCQKHFIAAWMQKVARVRITCRRNWTCRKEQLCKSQRRSIAPNVQQKWLHLVPGRSFIMIRVLVWTQHYCCEKVPSATALFEGPWDFACFGTICLGVWVLDLDTILLSFVEGIAWTKVGWYKWCSRNLAWPRRMVSWNRKGGCFCCLTNCDVKKNRQKSENEQPQKASGFHGLHSQEAHAFPAQAVHEILQDSQLAFKLCCRQLRAALWCKGWKENALYSLRWGSFGYFVGQCCSQLLAGASSCRLRFPVSCCKSVDLCCNHSVKVTCKEWDFHKRRLRNLSEDESQLTKAYGRPLLWKENVEDAFFVGIGSVLRLVRMKWSDRTFW